MTTIPDPYAQPAAPAPRGGLARAALIVAIVLVAWNVLQQALSYFLPLALRVADMDYSAIGAILGSLSIVAGLLAVAAVVLAILSLTRETGRRAAAGAALGIGGVSLLSIVLGIVFAATANFL